MSPLVRKSAPHARLQDEYRAERNSSRVFWAFSESPAVTLQTLGARRQDRGKFPEVQKASDVAGEPRELPRNTKSSSWAKKQRDVYGL